MNYEVNRVTYQTAKEWVMKIHYAHRTPSISYAFGLYDNGVLKGICTFGVPASPSLCKGVCGEEYRNIVLELNRLVISEGMPKNTASYFVSRCIKKLPKPTILVSYADTKMSHIGYVYQATNWIYTGATKPRTDQYAGEGKHSRHSLGDKTKRVARSSKHRYVYFNGCKKSIKNALRYKKQDYPKGDIGRYETDESILDQNVYSLF